MSPLSLLEAQLLKLLPVAVARQRANNIKQQQNNKIHMERKTLYVDVSVFSKYDAGTGIQRVVREIIFGLTSCKNISYDVVLVAAEKHGSYQTTNIKNINLNLNQQLSSKSINPKYGDIFLGLDLTTGILPKHYAELLRWKRTGVSIQIVIYDLLPVLCTDWFNKSATKTFKAWLKTIAIFADRFHCISKTVNTELVEWFKSKYKITLERESTCVFPLGSNLQRTVEPNAKEPKKPVADARVFISILKFVSEKSTTLMVGTVEPRKGHAEVLAAFNELWEQGSQEQLLIVGKPGWKTRELQNYLIAKSAKKDNDKIQPKLMWLQDADDEILVQLYKSVTGVVAASKGEGYGLPLIEAAFFDKPILARDIPVFREVGLGNITFFPEANQSTLSSKTLKNWLESNSCGSRREKTADIPNWDNATKTLLHNVCMDRT